MTSDSGYPATIRLPMRPAYLVGFLVLFVGVILVGAALVRHVVPFVLLPGGTPIGRILVVFLLLAGVAVIAVGLVYLVGLVVAWVGGRLGIVLDADGVTDATMLTPWSSIRLHWGNILRIDCYTATVRRSSPVYVKIELADASVYQGYSLVKKTMTHTRYRRGSRMVVLGLLENTEVVFTRGLTVTAERLSDVMGAYLTAWREAHAQHGGGGVTSQTVAADYIRTLTTGHGKKPTDGIA